MLASRLGLPPPQDPLGAAKESSDCKVAVLGSNVEAHILTNELAGQEELQTGLCNLMVVVAVSSKKEDLLFSVLPSSGAVSTPIPVQLKRVGAPCLELCKLLGQGELVHQVLMFGMQSMPFLVICWQLTLWQRHWERSSHMQLHWVWNRLSTRSQDIIRQSQHCHGGWAQPQLLKGIQNGSRHSADPEDFAASWQADKSHIGDARIQASKLEQQLLVQTRQDGEIVLALLTASLVEDLVIAEPIHKCGVDLP